MIIIWNDFYFWGQKHEWSTTKLCTQIEPGKKFDMFNQGYENWELQKKKKMSYRYPKMSRKRVMMKQIWRRGRHFLVCCRWLRFCATSEATYGSNCDPRNREVPLYRMINERLNMCRCVTNRKLVCCFFFFCLRLFSSEMLRNVKLITSAPFGSLPIETAGAVS